VKPPLWHFTCDHSCQRIGLNGLIKPAAMLAPFAETITLLAGVAWFTDLEAADVRALGLTSRLITCDRTAHRYTVTNSDPCVPWVVVRRMYPRELVDDIESNGAMPMHWFVSSVPVKATLNDWKAAAS